MDIREIREQLGRVKPYYLKNEMLRAVGSAVLGVKGVVQMGTPPTTEVRSLIREGMQLLSRDETIRETLKTPLNYQAGQERSLLAQLASLYKQLLEEQNREDRDVAFARKQKLDQALNLGMRFLSQNQISEADAQFAEAVAQYKDEHTMFRLIAKALMEAGEYKRAMPYLKKGLEALPTDQELLDLFEQIKEKRAAGAGQSPAAE